MPYHGSTIPWNTIHLICVNSMWTGIFAVFPAPRINPGKYWVLFAVICQFFAIIVLSYRNLKISIAYSKKCLFIAHCATVNCSNSVPGCELDSGLFHASSYARDWAKELGGHTILLVEGRSPRKLTELAMKCLSKLLLRSGTLPHPPSTFHRPKQVIWASSTSMGQGNMLLPWGSEERRVNICWTTIKFIEMLNRYLLSDYMNKSTYTDMERPLTHPIKWKRQVAKQHIYYDPSYKHKYQKIRPYTNICTYIFINAYRRGRSRCTKRLRV